MAVACHEAHLNGSSENAFHASVMAMGAKHSVKEAEDFGAQIEAAESKIGKENVRQLMNGMSWSQAKAFLAKATGPQSAKRK
jgi:hypothetical protein